MATTTEPQENGEFTITPEMQEYIDVLKATGQVTALETDEQRYNFKIEFNRWKKAGSPRAKPPDIPLEENPIPMKLYRIKIYGRQKIFWRDTKGVLHGKEIINTPVMKIGKDAMTGKDMEIIDHYNQKVNYTLDYNKTIGDKMVDDAMDRCFNPTFYFIKQLEKYSVNSADFNKDFEEIWKICKAGKYIFSD